MEAIYLRWEDSCAFEAGWKNILDYEGTCATCETVGWLVSEDEQSLLVGLSYDGDSDFNCVMRIPKSGVLYRQTLAPWRLLDGESPGEEEEPPAEENHREG